MIEQRKLYQATMYRLDGANLAHYEKLLSDNTHALWDLDVNVFDIDDANRDEVEAHGKLMAEMSFSEKLLKVLKYWSPLIFIVVVLWYFLF